MKKYSIQVDRVKKEVIVVLDGFFSEKDTENFARDYKDCVRSLNTGEYIINMDCAKMHLIRGDLVPVVKYLMSEYVADGFKRTDFVLTNSVGLLRLQVKYIVRKLGSPAQLNVII